MARPLDDNIYAKDTENALGFFEDHPDGQSWAIGIAYSNLAVAHELAKIREFLETRSISVISANVP